MCIIKESSLSIATLEPALPSKSGKVPSTRTHQQTVRLAWAILLSAFAIALALLVSLGYAIWHYHHSATIARRSMLFVHGLSEWVNWKRKGHTIVEQATHQQWVDEGDQISIARSAAYGQVSTIRLFDYSTVDLWAGAEITLETIRTSRWNNRFQDVVFRQTNGYIRYDIQNNQPYQVVRFRVRLQHAVVELDAGGSYSIAITPPDRHYWFSPPSTTEPVVCDIAVRSGAARILQDQKVISLAAGQRAMIEPTGEISAPMPALWNLIRDGTFQQYDEEAYNNTTIVNQPALRRSDTWEVYGIYSGGASEGSSPGYFRLSPSCHPPKKGNDCDQSELIQSAWFIRGNQQTKSFTTGIIQKLGPNGAGVDISEYRSLVFSMWARILHQSPPLTGDAGTECPVMVRFLAKRHSPIDPEEERVLCIYTVEESDRKPVYAPGVIYYPIQRYEWFPLFLELRDPEWLPDMRYLRSVSIYANGHDYDARVTSVRLIGSHYAPASTLPITPSPPALVQSPQLHFTR